MKLLIEKVFIKTINDAIKGENHDSIRKYLLNHPARHRMFDNLEKEIKNAGVAIDSLSGDLFKKKKSIEDLVKSLTLTFAKVALDVKSKELSTAIKGEDNAIEEGIKQESYLSEY